MTDDKRSKKLEQIRMLLDKADSTPYEAEADALRAKADHLMTEYAIERWQLDQLKPRNEQAKPVLVWIKICERDAIIKDQLLGLFGTLVYHRDCQWVIRYYHEGQVGIFGGVVGFEEDLEYIERLFTSLHMHLSKSINPEPEKHLTRAENVYKMKAAGMKWADICRKLGVPFDPRNHTTEQKELFSEYKRYAKANDLPTINVQPKNFVMNFAQGYEHRIWNRLYEIKQRRKDEVKVEGGTTGMELALRSRSAQVLDEYKLLFPHLFAENKEKGGRKKVAVYRGPQFKRNNSAQEAGAQAANNADLGQDRVGVTKELGQ